MGTVAVLNGKHHGGRHRRHVHHHRRFRPRRRTAQPRADHAGGARVLHPRRAAGLGPRRSQPPHGASGSAAAPATPARTLDEQAEATAAMMAYFANFTGKLSHGIYKMPPNHFNLAWSADKVGAMRNQVYVMGRFDLDPDEAFVVDVNDGGAEYFTVPLSNIWGTTLDIVDRTGSLNKAQSVPNDDGTYTYVISPVDPGRGQLDRLRRAARRHPDAADGRVRRRRAARGPRCARAGRRLDRPRRRGARPAQRDRRGAGGRTRRSAAPPTCAAFPKGRTDDGPLVDHRMLYRDRSRNRPRRTGSRPLRGGDRASAPSRWPISSTSSATAHWCCALDVTDKNQIAAAVHAADDAFGGVDVLVNNAGNGYLSAVEEGEDDKVRKLFDTNYFGVVDTIKAVLPGMRARGSGHIVNISSMTGLVANPPNAYYSSTKFALEALTEALAQEVRPFGIKVTAIEPGAFRTDWAARSMWESSTPIGDYDENVGARKTSDQGVRRSPARRSAQGRRGGADGHHPRRTAVAAAARPRRAEGGARQDSPRCRRRSTSGKPSPRTSTFRRESDGNEAGSW